MSRQLFCWLLVMQPFRFQKYMYADALRSIGIS
jgi:hypothetical protein